MTNQFRQTLLSGQAHQAAALIREKHAMGANGDDLASVTIGRQEGRRGDHREGDRHRLTDEQATARWQGSDVTAELVNLSGGGAMIQAALEPKLWDRVDLLFGDGPAIECAVRWIRDGRIGLEFAHETCIEGDSDIRNGILLDVIQRSFPTIVAVPIEPQAIEPAEEQSTRRTERRHPLIWSGHLLYDHDSHPARLRNISATGALVDTDGELAAGKEVMLDLGNAVTAYATVGWARGSQAGLLFAERFDIKRLAEARPEVTGQRWERPSFLDQGEADSPWDSNWDRATLEELKSELEGFLKH